MQSVVGHFAEVVESNQGQADWVSSTVLVPCLEKYQNLFQDDELLRVRALALMMSISASLGFSAT